MGLEIEWECDRRQVGFKARAGRRWVREMPLKKTIEQFIAHIYVAFAWAGARLMSSNGRATALSFLREVRVIGRTDAASN